VQIQGANQKEVFGRSDPTSRIIEKAIEAQAKIIKGVDDRRRAEQKAKYTSPS
jgi:hypothetical protein